jgi:hypothetical protein
MAAVQSESAEKLEPAPSLKEIFTLWWPLAASWLLMSAENPTMSAIVARLANPKIHLAAFGGIVYPLALIIEAPIIMMLAASTTLSKDWASYRKVYKIMMWTCAALTGLHIAVAFTPLYYLVIEGIIGAPAEIVEPGRIGLIIMLPWTWAIGYRRFQQGMLIRLGYSQTISTGTIIRLSLDVLVLIIGYWLKLPGIIVGTSAIAVGVVSEATYAGLKARSVWDELKGEPPVDPPLTMGPFLHFYIPLAMTSLLTLVVQPIGSAALSRMPDALDSLAVWPVVTGVIFMLRSAGLAYNEVVVALLDQRNARENLRKFAKIIGAVTTAFLLLVVSTPLSDFWFRQVSALPPSLADMARRGLWIAILMPIFSVLQSWFQGNILHSQKTRGISEAVVVFLITIGIVLGIGIAWNQITGLYVGLAAYVLGYGTQDVWLWLRSRPALKSAS